jgi:hypothetical protein
MLLAKFDNGSLISLSSIISRQMLQIPILVEGVFGEETDVAISVFFFCYSRIKKFCNFFGSVVISKYTGFVS